MMEDPSSENNLARDNVPKPIPKLVRNGTSYQLLVDGAQFIILGGELSAFSMTSDIYVSRLWGNIRRTGASRIFGAVAWDTIEHIEGQFDFSTLDSIIVQARENEMRMVLQWFGSLKGGHSDNLSDYAPPWVKHDAKRFPKMKIRDGIYNDEGEVIGKAKRTIESASLFNFELLDAEKTAFRRLMKHIRSIDKHKRTVIVIQIGTHIGLTRDFRDCSAAANAAFGGDVPSDFMAYYQSLGSAIDVSGSHNWTQFAINVDEAEELFSAYTFASYVNSLAKVGKREYPLPIFTDVALRDAQGIFYGSPRDKKSIFVTHWNLESICSQSRLHCPTLHAPYEKTCQAWGSENKQPLLIQAHPQGQDDICNLWSAFGTHAAIGVVMMKLDRIDITQTHIPAHYKFLRRLTPILLAARQNNKQVVGFSFGPSSNFGVQTKTPFQTTFDGLHITIDRFVDAGYHGGGCGLLIEREHGKVLLTGHGYQLKAKSVSPKAVFTRVLEFVKKELNAGQPGKLLTLRTFHAEETNGGRVAQMPSSNPMIAEVKFYTLRE